MPRYPDRVQIVEVGPRDGLQNETLPVPTPVKIEFIRRLVSAGLKQIEVTSFVHPKFVPQLADAVEVIAALPEGDGVCYSSLVPNEKGLDRAIESGVKRVAVFTAASDTFTQKNIRMTVDESLDVFAPVVSRAIDAGLTVRGYVSTCFVCPYEGDVDKTRVGTVTKRLLAMGVDQVAISDTTGAAVPTDIFETVGHLLDGTPAEKLALHLHDTYGTALANVLVGLELGISTFDASAGGLGGCPFAPGASGNLATEDLVYMLDRMGIETGVEVAELVNAADVVAGALGRALPSRNWQRLRGSCGDAAGSV